MVWLMQLCRVESKHHDRLNLAVRLISLAVLAVMVLVAVIF